MIDGAWTLPSVSVIYAIFRAKGLKQMIKLSDKIIWYNADTEQAIINGW